MHIAVTLLVQHSRVQNLPDKLYHGSSRGTPHNFANAPGAIPLAVHVFAALALALGLLGDAKFGLQLLQLLPDG